MKIYILTCINEDYEVVTAEAYITLEAAQDALLEAYKAERSCFYTEDTLVGSELGAMSARVNYGDYYFYDWAIKTTELAL